MKTYKGFNKDMTCRDFQYEEGKEYGTVIDFSDDFGLLYGYEKKRRGYYKKNSYTFL